MERKCQFCGMWHGEDDEFGVCNAFDDDPPEFDEEVSQ